MARIITGGSYNDLVEKLKADEKLFIVHTNGNAKEVTSQADYLRKVASRKVAREPASSFHFEAR